MVRKRKKKKSRKKKSTAIKSADLPAVGQKYLSNGQFSEAIKIFRRLHEKPDGDRWSKLFRRAFIGRINQLTAKGMPKEALTIYDNLATVFPNPDHCLHIRLLANAGEFPKALETYAASAGTLTRTQKQALDELLAARLLSGSEGLLDALPEDSVLRLHYPHADRALQAYCREEDSAVQDNLQNIPFRSPYKNFRLALKGMLAFHDNRQEALSYFDQIDRDSPFLRITVPYRSLCREKNKNLQTNKLTSLDHQVIQALEGLDKNTLGFLDSLRNQVMSPPALYQKFITSGKCLGKKRLCRICRRLLPHAPDKIRDFTRRFGGITDEFNTFRLIALNMEIEDDYYDIVDTWQLACNELIKKNKPGDELKIALIYRHIADIMAQDRHEYSSGEIQEQLEKSLRYDPDDKETWLKLVDLKRNNTTKQYQLINKMLAKFPGDKDILLCGVEATIRRGAFKKASRLAMTLLEIDPINPKVRELLIDAHLSHARKLAGQNKYELACRECSQAISFDRTDLGLGRIEIIYGLITMLSGDEENGVKLLQDGESKAAHPILAHFLIRLEAGLLDMPIKRIKSFTARLKQSLKSPPDKAVLLQLVDAISKCDEKKHIALQDFHTIMTPWLKKGSRLVLSKEELLDVCRTFHRRHYHDLLLVYAKTALKSQPKNPRFTFYHIYAKTAGGRKRLGRKLYHQLDNAWEEAMNQGDKATATLIGNFLTHNSPAMSLMGENPFQIFQEMINGEFARHLEEGTEPTEDEINRFLAKISSLGVHENEYKQPRKKKDNDTDKPTQLDLF